MRIANGSAADEFAAVAGPRADHAVSEEAWARIRRRHLGQEIPLAVRRVDLSSDHAVRRAVHPHLRALGKPIAEVDLHAQFRCLRKDPLDEEGVRALARLVLYPVFDRAVFEDVFRTPRDVAVGKHLAVKEREPDELAVVLDFLHCANRRQTSERGKNRHNLRFHIFLHRPYGTPLKRLGYDILESDNAMNFGTAFFHLPVAR